MIDVTADVAPYHMPVEGNDWEQWKARIWNQIADGPKGLPAAYPGLAPLEQWMLRSKREKRCIDCGADGTVCQESIIVVCVDFYWLCDDCAAYWEQRKLEE